MGIEYCHKLRAMKHSHAQIKHLRAQIKHPRAHFFPPSTFPCTCELFFILHLCLLAQYCGLQGEKQLEHAQSSLGILSPARVRVDCSLAKASSPHLKNFSPARARDNFFSGHFLSVKKIRKIK